MAGALQRGHIDLWLLKKVHCTSSLSPPVESPNHRYPYPYIQSPFNLKLRTQLDFLYAQILSTLTLSSLNRAFSTRPNFDLRNLLGGTEIFLDALADTMISSDPGILLGSLEVNKLRKTTREKINTALLNARHEDLLYGMIVAEGRLVSVIRPRRHSLHPPGTNPPYR